MENFVLGTHFKGLYYYEEKMRSMNWIPACESNPAFVTLGYTLIRICTHSFITYSFKFYLTILLTAQIM